jgi:hypothetical protein
VPVTFASGEDERVGVGAVAVHHPCVGAAPSQQDRRRVRLRDRDRRVAQRQAARVVGPDLVAGRAVGLERRRHRRGAPLVVVAVGVGLPLVDPGGEVPLEALRVVGQPERGERHLDAGRGAPVLADLVGEDGVRVDTIVTSTAARTGSVGAGVGEAPGGSVAAGVGGGVTGGSVTVTGRHGRPVGRRRPGDEPLDLRDQPVELVAQPERVRRDQARAQRATQHDEHEHDDDRGRSEGRRRPMAVIGRRSGSGSRAPRAVGSSGPSGDGRPGPDATLEPRCTATLRSGRLILPALARSSPQPLGRVQERARSATIDRPSRPGRQTGEPIPWTASSPTSESPARRPCRRPSAPPARAR